MKYRQCVSILVIRPAQSGAMELLVVHKPRRRDAWQIPQGGIESGETIEEAAMRELEEETDIRLKTPPRRSDYSYVYDYPESFKKREKPKYDGQKLVFVTALVPIETKVTVDERELDRFKWIPPHTLWKFLRRKRYRLIVESVIAEAKNVHGFDNNISTAPE